ncbi:hypothetical protein ACSSS7_001820 [Eimeria intestinalis]
MWVGSGFRGRGSVLNDLRLLSLEPPLQQRQRALANTLSSSCWRVLELQQQQQQQQQQKQAAGLQPGTWFHQTARSINATRAQEAAAAGQQQQQQQDSSSSISGSGITSGSPSQKGMLHPGEQKCRIVGAALAGDDLHSRQDAAAAAAATAAAAAAAQMQLAATEIVGDNCLGLQPQFGQPGAEAAPAVSTAAAATPAAAAPPAAIPAAAAATRVTAGAAAPDEVETGSAADDIVEVVLAQPSPPPAAANDAAADATVADPAALEVAAAATAAAAAAAGGVAAGAAANQTAAAAAEDNSVEIIELGSSEDEWVDQWQRPRRRAAAAAAAALMTLVAAEETSGAAAARAAAAAAATRAAAVPYRVTVPLAKKRDPAAAAAVAAAAADRRVFSGSSSRGSSNSSSSSSSLDCVPDEKRLPSNPLRLPFFMSERDRKEATAFIVGAHGLHQRLATPLLSAESMSLLRAHRRLNDEVINFFFSLLQRRNEESVLRGDAVPKCHFFNSFFNERLKVASYEGVSRWTKRVDLFSYDLLLLPVHHKENEHWALGVVDFRYFIEKP